MIQADPRAPLPLRIAALVVLLQGVVTFGYGISEALHISTARLTMGVTTSLFFCLFGAGLVLCAWGLTQVHVWARGPLLFAELCALGLAWNFREGGTWPVSVVLAGTGLVVLVGMLHPESREALEG